MRQVDARTGIEWLEREECLRLLAADTVGRLGVVDGGTPVVLPVNYVVDRGTIVFRTDEGTKLDAGLRDRACFEIDGFDRERRSGWSVLATGRIVEEAAPEVIDRLRGLLLSPWAGGAKAHWLRLVPERVTGRRVGPAAW